MRNIPVGSTVHQVELKPGKGAQLACSAGAYVQIIARDGAYVTIRLRSGEMRKVLSEGRATIGEVGVTWAYTCELGKAGASRWRGVRPTVRGVVMNLVDHPWWWWRPHIWWSPPSFSLGAFLLRASRLVRTNALTSTSYVVVINNL